MNFEPPFIGSLVRMVQFARNFIRPNAGTIPKTECLASGCYDARPDPACALATPLARPKSEKATTPELRDAVSAKLQRNECWVPMLSLMRYVTETP